jgi:hypothetical protein
MSSASSNNSFSGRVEGANSGSINRAYCVMISSESCDIVVVEEHGTCDV